MKVGRKQPIFWYSGPVNRSRHWLAHASGAQCLVVLQLIQVCSPCNRNFNWLFVCPLHFAALLLSGLPEKNDHRFFPSLFSVPLSLSFGLLFTDTVLIRLEESLLFGESPIYLSSFVLFGSLRAMTLFVSKCRSRLGRAMASASSEVRFFDASLPRLKRSNQD